MDGLTNIHLNAAMVTMSCSAQAGLTKRKIFVQVIFLQTISTLLTDPFLSSTLLCPNVQSLFISGFRP